MPAQINAISRGFNGTISSNLSAHRVGRCCRRRGCHREAALFFYLELEICPREQSTIRSNGTLHPDLVSTSCALTVPLHPVSRCQPPAASQLCSRVEVEGELKSTTMMAPTIAGLGWWVAATESMHMDARSALAGSSRRVICINSRMAPFASGGPICPLCGLRVRVGTL